MAAHKRTALKACTTCDGDFIGHGNSRYCSPACRNRRRELARSRPCTRCGESMVISRTSAVSPICLPCRRARPASESRKLPPIQTWNCVSCGGECDRPTVRGVMPKWCESCRQRAGARRIESRAPVRRRVYARDRWTCWLCDRSVDGALIGSDSPWRPSLDHVVPVSLGGSDADSNLRLAHVWCNAVRGDGSSYSPEDFRDASRIR